ncbi:MAG TPA: benzoylformate decarboxylase [Solirubrobacteraceae bacterium]|nr:benzoylformate decarboxylase [Solirubrobacteraceae bacterium]
MASVREVTFDLLRAHGMTRIFGNPGSTELPMLRDFPEDFSYVLGLQELVVVGMADGFAQASGRPTHVNLHTTPGVGNAVGGIANAQANRAPLLITAGQQVRAHIAMEANLTNREAVLGPRPYVKWSHEPARAQDVPHAIARAINHTMLPPRGPAFVSIPMDDWGAEVDEDASRQLLARTLAGAAQPDRQALEQLAASLRDARAPALVAGPDIDASGGWDAAVALAEQQRLPVWATPAPGGGRIGFPEDHANFQGVLPPAIGPVGEALAGYDLVLVAGSSVFPYYPYIPGALLAAGTTLVQITCDPAEAARAPMGSAIVGDVAGALTELVRLLAPSTREQPPARALPGALSPASSADGEGEPAQADPLSGSAAMAALADAWPEDGIAVVETPSSTIALRNRLRLSRPGSYYFSASGGLGFGIAAAVGVQLAQPGRPVVCVLGEGSAQYGITALWSAATYKVPVTFLVLRNDEYMILKWFAQLEQADGAPGLDLPGLDVAAVAQAYGVPSREVSGREQLTEALRTDIAAQDGPRLVQVPVASGMWLD